MKFLLPAFAILLSSLFSSCGPVTPNPNATKPLTAIFINPHESGSYKYFKVNPEYPKTYKVYKDKALLARTNPSNSSVVIDLTLQRGLLMNGNEVAMDYPVSTGNSRYPTPADSYLIMEKVVDKRSNLYGKIYDAEGKVINYDADSRDDTIPEGGKFVGAGMANWMRLTGDGIGMHRGRVPRYPASHGCIRTPSSVVTIVYSKVKIGTPVTVRR